MSGGGVPRFFSQQKDGYLEENLYLCKTKRTSGCILHLLLYITKHNTNHPIIYIK